MQFDLLLKGGRVVDPASGLNAARDVAFADGRVAAIETGLPTDGARKVIDCTGAIVAPGLIDLHSHVYWGGTSLGVDADGIAVRSGTTTFVDAGSAGAGNFLGFRRHVIEPCSVRILAFLNISFAGIFAFAENLMVGECADIRLCEPREAVPCAREHSDLIVGMKVRAGRIAGGKSGIAPVDLAIEAADKLQMPLMTHIDYPPPGRSEVIERMRSGDILTHCYRPFPNAPVDGRGFIRSDALDARDRGVFFDIGHGMGSFDFEVAKLMLKEGFEPDAISSDVHLLCVDGPAFDLLVCLSKFLALGMSLGAVLAKATSRPAAAIGRPELGQLAAGGIGDAAVLRLVEGAYRYADVVGNTLVGSERLVSEGIVYGGAWRPNEGPDAAPDVNLCTPQPYRSHADALGRHLRHRH